MPKKTLVEVNAFAKLLSFFYDERSKGNDASGVVQKAISKSSNPNVQRAYDAWKRDNEKLLIATRNMLLKADLDTTDVDALLKKYHNY